MTFKQLEALYWIAKLGGFAQAANQLHTSQSAVSKRVHEGRARGLHLARLTTPSASAAAIR